jgi:hypothetical protein
MDTKLLKSPDFQMIVIRRHYKRSEAIQECVCVSHLWIASLRL